MYDGVQGGCAPDWKVVSEESKGGDTMNVLEGGTERIAMKQGVIPRNNKVLAAWNQVLIFSKVIASWSYLVSLLGAGNMGVYIASLILRDDSIGC